jgi:hypothetical protein
MVVMFATLTAAVVFGPFAFASAVPVMAAFSVARETFVAEFAEAVMMLARSLRESLPAKFVMMMLTRRSALLAVVLWSRILRPRSRLLATTLRCFLRELLRTIAGLRTLPRPTLSKPLPGLHAKWMMEMLLTIGLRAATLLTLRSRGIPGRARLRPLHPLGCAWRQ